MDAMGTFGNQTTTATPTPSGEYALMEDVFYSVTKIGSLLVILFGLPGNAMAFLVATKPSNRHLSTCTYMAGLALADSFVLVHLIYVALMFFWGIGNYLPNPGLAYKFTFFIGYSGGITSGIFLAEMSVDRAIAVWAPMNAVILCSPSRAKKVMAITAFFTFLFDVQLFWALAYSEDEMTGMALLEFKTPNYPIFATISSIHQLAIGTILPFLIIIGCNIGIIIGVKRADNKRKQMTATSGVKDDNKKAREKESKYMMRMLVLVSLAYVFCSIPVRVYDLLLQIPAVGSKYDFAERYWFLRFNIEYWTLGVLWDANYAVNFYMYSIGGGKKFRNDAVEIISGLCKRK